MLCTYENLQTHFTQVQEEGGRGRENGEEVLFPLADSSQRPDSTKQNMGSLRGRQFNNNLNTVKFSVLVFMSRILPPIWLSLGFWCLDAAQLTTHAGKKQWENHQENQKHGDI